MKRWLIPEAADRETEKHIVVVTACIGIVVIQIAVPREVCDTLGRTPPGSVVVNGAEYTIEIT